MDVWARSRVDAVEQVGHAWQWSGVGEKLFLEGVSLSPELVVAEWQLRPLLEDTL